MSRSFLLPLVGCFGQPVAENPTQVMVEAGFASLGLNWRYITTEVSPDGLSDAVAGARAMGFVGFNCTIPHKVAVIEHLDALGESAAIMQAVNCVVRREGRLIGENTDGKGFVRAVSERRDPKELRVAMFGGGGAARAIAVELALAGISELTIVNRTPERGHTLTDLLRRHFASLDVVLVTGTDPFTVPASTDLLVNATSVGLYPDVGARLPIEFHDLTPATLVADVVFNPPDTELLRTARRIGCDTVDGLEMLVGQGVLGIEYWTGMVADPAAMQSALVRALDESGAGSTD